MSAFFLNIPEDVVRKLLSYCNVTARAIEHTPRKHPSPRLPGALYPALLAVARKRTMYIFSAK